MSAPNSTTPAPERMERWARMLCRADGGNPDVIVRREPLWHRYRETARGAIALADQESEERMVAGREYAGDLDDHDDIEKTIAIVRDAHPTSWLLADDGRLCGLVSGDMGYAATSIVIGKDHLDAWAFYNYRPDEAAPPPSDPHVEAGGVVPAARRGVLPCTVALPTPDMVRARLVTDGWERHEMRYAGYAAYRRFLPNFNDSFELVLPDGMSDRWQSHVEQALRTIAGLEDREDDGAPDRPIGDVAASIIAAAPPPSEPRGGADPGPQGDGSTGEVEALPVREDIHGDHNG